MSKELGPRSGDLITTEEAARIVRNWAGTVFGDRGAEVSAGLAKVLLSDEKGRRAESRQQIVYGVKAIADHLGVKRRQAQGLVERDRLPVFREGRVVCSTKSALDDWLRERDRNARGDFVVVKRRGAK